MVRMHNKAMLTILLLSAVMYTCGGTAREQQVHPGSELFRHHYVTRDLPGDTGWGYGTPVLADFDNDGDPDYAFCTRNDSLYWFENREARRWIRHTAGPMPLRTLGAAVLDVDGDG